MSRCVLFLLAALLLLPFTTRPAAAQVMPPDTLSPVAEPIPPEGPRPRSAFIKALAVPGWGHFSVGAHRRGVVYATIQGTSWAMLLTTMNRLETARDAERAIEAVAVDSVAAAMAADTVLARRLGNDRIAYEAALLTYPGLQGSRDLAVSRQRHRQDWIVYTLVFTFASAIDAYVAAHLADFPVEVSATRSRDGSTALRFSVPVGSVR
jgi:hypothetical protein